MLRTGETQGCQATGTLSWHATGGGCPVKMDFDAASFTVDFVRPIIQVRQVSPSIDNALGASITKPIVLKDVSPTAKIAEFEFRSLDIPETMSIPLDFTLRSDPPDAIVFDSSPDKSSIQLAVGTTPVRVAVRAGQSHNCSASAELNWHPVVGAGCPPLLQAEAATFNVEFLKPEIIVQEQVYGNSSDAAALISGPITEANILPDMKIAELQLTGKNAPNGTAVLVDLMLESDPPGSIIFDSAQDQTHLQLPVGVLPTIVGLRSGTVNCCRAKGQLSVRSASSEGCPAVINPPTVGFDLAFQQGISVGWLYNDGTSTNKPAKVKLTADWDEKAGKWKFLRRDGIPVEGISVSLPPCADAVQYVEAELSGEARYAVSIEEFNGELQNLTASGASSLQTKCRLSGGQVHYLRFIPRADAGSRIYKGELRFAASPSADFTSLHPTSSVNVEFEYRPKP
jgi:hypothetical protein